MIRLMTATAAAALLMAGAASAQTADTAVTPPAAAVESAPVSDSMAVPAPMGGASTTTVTTVTNGPVPDTVENRAKYGQPMSRAGKRTTPAGN